MLEYKPPAQHFAYEIAALGNKKNNLIVIRGEKFKMGICLKGRQKVLTTVTGLGFYPY